MERSRTRRLCILSILLAHLVLTVCLCFAFLFTWRCSDGQFTHGAVSADSEMCSNIGRHMLQQGGSAVDGAIAALLCTSVVNPQSMGLGGGSIFTIMDQTGNVKVISSRETVPKVFRDDLLMDCTTEMKLTTGAQWIGVPGELRGYERAHRLYGRLPWAQLFEPTIRLARDGFPMPDLLSGYLHHHFIKPHLEGSALCELFCYENKTVLNKGATLRYPKLAETMETVAKHGADAFYTGQVARNLVQDVKDAGGTLSLEDLGAYEVRVTDALAVTLGEYTMHVPPPPAGGTLLSLILRVMQGFPLSPSSLTGRQKTLTMHRFLEATKFANAQKSIVQDPMFKVVSEVGEEFVDRVRSLMRDDYAYNDTLYTLAPASDRFGTTHVSVLAADGTAVSVTSTINEMFGSMVYSPKTGIILNNELADFCGRDDVIFPGEQPPSSMSPAILLSESRDKTLIIGASGGSMITTAMALSIMNHLWFGLTLEDSIKAPVVFVDSENTVMFENGTDQALIKNIRALGHRVEDFPYFFNVVNAVTADSRCISAVSDARKRGKAAGY